MTKEVTTFETDLALLKALFGPPPVLSTESEKAYYEILAQLLQCFSPRDFMGRLLIKQLTDCTWEMHRYTRKKTLAIELKFRKLRKFEAERIKLRAQRKQELARDKADEAAPELEHMFKLEDLLDSHSGDVRQILDRSPEELDHARALEAGIKYQEQLDGLLNTAVLRRNDAIRQFELYEEGLGRRLRRAADEALYAIMDEIEQHNDPEGQPTQLDVPLAPSAEGTQ